MIFAQLMDSSNAQATDAGSGSRNLSEEQVAASARMPPNVGRAMANVVVKNSATGTRTRVARVRAEYPNQLDYYGGSCQAFADSYGKTLDLGADTFRKRQIRLV